MVKSCKTHPFRWQIPMVNAWLMISFTTLMWVKQCHKPSPSHHHVLVGGMDIPCPVMFEVKITLFYPHYRDIDIHNEYMDNIYRDMKWIHTWKKSWIYGGFHKWYPKKTDGFSLGNGSHPNLKWRGYPRFGNLHMASYPRLPTVPAAAHLLQAHERDAWWCQMDSPLIGLVKYQDHVTIFHWNINDRSNIVEHVFNMV